MLPASLFLAKIVKMTQDSEVILSLDFGFHEQLTQGIWYLHETIGHLI